MDYKHEINELIDSIEQEHVLRFIHALLYFMVNEKNGIAAAENLIRLFGTD